MSHLTQVSGLKYTYTTFYNYTHIVSPYTGEWIEILADVEEIAEQAESHLTQVSGLKSCCCTK